LRGKLTDPYDIARVAHAVWKIQDATEWPTFDSKTMHNILETATIPNPHEQGDNLIRWLGRSLKGPGEEKFLSFLGHGAIIGSPTPEAFLFVIAGLINDFGLLSVRGVLPVMLPHAQREREHRWVRGHF
jgi:hypothetical protein